MAKAMDIADYIIYKANKLGKPVSNLQIQKIMYFLHAIFLVNSDGDKKLISDEQFERWDYGPVSPSVYSEYSRYGSNRIESPVEHTEINYDNNQINLKNKNFSPSDLNADIKSFINEHLPLFLDYGPFELVEESHMEPQWKELRWSENYNDDKTLEFYKNKAFWEK